MLLLGAACRKPVSHAVAAPNPANKPTAGDTPTTSSAMKAGINLLDNSHDPEHAAIFFLKVLQETPDHYGATYQLARALTAQGHFDEARPLWRKLVSMAVTFHDGPVLQECEREIVAHPPPRPAPPAGSATNTGAAGASGNIGASATPLTVDAGTPDLQRTGNAVTASSAAAPAPAANVPGKH